MDAIPETLDRWATWLLERRSGGDEAAHAKTLEFLAPVRERVLTNASIAPGDTVLDVGAGDGLIAFGALERVGPDGRVVFSDVSRDLLEHCRGLARELGVAGRCDFVEAAAEDLAPFEDGSVDVVTTRSVVIYVQEKQRAFDGLHRVLRPGGRLSIFEPINSFAYPSPPGIFAGYDVTPVADLARRVGDAWESAASSTLIDFDERDLLAFAERAGFDEIHLRYEADVARDSWLTGEWDVVLRSAPNPHASTLADAIETALTPDEAERFAAHLRPLVEAGAARQRSAVAYLWAVKS